MDPDEALRACREWRDAYDNAPDSIAAREAAERLAEHFTALDDWISTGGFLPAAWRPAGAPHPVESKRYVTNTGPLGEWGDSADPPT